MQLQFARPSGDTSMSMRSGIMLQVFLSLLHKICESSSDIDTIIQVFERLEMIAVKIVFSLLNCHFFFHRQLGRPVKKGEPDQKDLRCDSGFGHCSEEVALRQIGPQMCRRSFW